MGRRGRQHGFSLIEVLLAMAIFSLAAYVLSQSFYNALKATDNLETESSEAADLRFVRQQVILEPELEVFEDGGTIETLLNGPAQWEVEVEQMQVADLFKVDLMIELEPREDESDPRIYKETLYLLRPTWSDPTERGEIITEARDKLTESRIGKEWD